MKQIKRIAVTLLASCYAALIYAQSNPIVNYLPAEAKMIVKINSASLGQKMKWEELTQYKMFQDLVKKMPGEGQEFLSNPAHSGIDISKGFFVVLTSKSSEKVRPVFYAIPKDTSQIASMMRKLNPGRKIVKTGNGQLMADSNVAVGWNRDIFVITMYDSSEKIARESSLAKLPFALRKVRALTEKCKTLLTKRQTPFDNPRFISLLNESGDVLVWIDNSTASMARKGNKAVEALNVFNKGFMRKGDFTAGVINFENGRVLMKVKQYLTAAVDSMYNKFPPTNLNPGLLRKLPDGHIILLSSFVFSPEMMQENLARAGSDKLIDSATKNKVKTSDILSAIKGDITIAATRVTQVPEDDSFTRKLGGIALFVSGTINNKEKFKDLSGLVMSENDSTKHRKQKPVILSNDSIFVVSLSPIAAQNFLASQGANEEAEKLIHPYLDNPSAFVIDLRTIFGIVSQSMARGKSEEENRQVSEVLGMFDKLVSYGGQHASGALTSTGELILTNKDENSLKQFMKLLDLSYSLKRKKGIAQNNSKWQPTQSKPLLPAATR